ncbi:MAG: FAD-dependent monooxygenase [Deltaproteobacteria bacterium]|nr:FAD-dependent monooxygenase [Deltaproteobacteria bacterium]
MTSRSMTDVDVLIVGAGPTGLVAAIDARRHGLSVRIVEQSPQRSPHSRALVLHSRSLEVLDDLGCVEPVLQAGREFRALNIVAGGRPGGSRRVSPARLERRAVPHVAHHSAERDRALPGGAPRRPRRHRRAPDRAALAP